MPGARCARGCPTIFWRALPEMHVLVTREAAAAARTAAALAVRGHDALIAPLTRTAPLPHEPFPLAIDALLLTSPNAADMFRPEAGPFLGTQVFAVGDRTAEAARAAGFRSVLSAQGDAGDLMGLVRSHLPKGAVLAYPAAEETARDLAGELARDGYAVVARKIYRSEPVERLGEAARLALAARRIDAVLHFSAAAASAYIALADAAGLSAEALAPLHLCLSERVAEPLLQHGASVRVAEKPNESALIALADA